MEIIVLQHLETEHPGILRDFFRKDGVRLKVIELDKGETIPSLTRFHGMLVMGGPQDVWQTREHPWLVDEIAAIRRFVVELKRPFLGICLGHQLLAAALGGEVGKALEPEVGVLDVTMTAKGRKDDLFARLGDPMPVLQWHGAEVTRAGEGVDVLARSPLCAIQAIRYGGHAYGIQFHVEVTPTTVPDWAAVPEYASALEQALGPGAVIRLQDDVARNMAAFNASARAVYDGFMRLMPKDGTSMAG